MNLKSALRQLYKRVHPDLFTDYPAEQAENERSFKLLQDYLHQARSPSQGPASRVAYHFRFFLLPQPHGLDVEEEPQEPPSQAAAADAPPGPQFQRVQLSLPPPQPKADSSSPGLSAAALKALSKLLAQCGLPPVAAEEREQQADAAGRLSTFLPEAAEVVRQHESGAALDEVRVANMRAAIRIAHRVVAGFQPGAFSGQQQVALLQRLVDALNLLSAEFEAEGATLDLSRLHLLICSKTSLDSLGTLCLASDDSAEDWADFLGGVDAGYARDKRAAAAALRQLEAGMAAALGVRMLFTAAHYIMTHEYRSFLERLAAHAAEHGPVQNLSSCSTETDSSTSSGSSSSSSSSRTSSSSSRTSSSPVKSLADVPVYVAPPMQHQQYDAAGSDQQQQQQQAVHESVGYISVTMDSAAAEVYHTIQEHAAAAAAILSARQQLQQELAELTASVRSRLQLRRLIRDALVSPADYKAACRRLLQHREHLLRCNIEGLSIRVSDKNRVAADGSLVDIAWDFEP
ncbi:hypothetical protein OEZ86_011358 [Tetradesmus obliquus]|nr:hypothetical protein OEZ86_011358 [Tetradesmus obliquus]